MSVLMLEKPDRVFVPLVGRQERQILRQFERQFGMELGEPNWTISPNDYMFGMRLSNYLLGGLWSVRCIRRGLAGRQPRSILDFGCGYGRTLRIMQLAFPDAALMGADITPDAVTFCQDELGVPTFQSAADPREIAIPQETFDLIWVGSVVTHVDAHHWPHFFKYFDAVMRPGGVLVFTMQGPDAAHRLRTGKVNYKLGDERTRQILDDFETGEFAYADYPWSPGYGISLARIEWVTELVESHSAFRVTDYNESGCHKHQDAVTCIKLPD
jgi:SAM-dependent methyltransferase